MATENPANNLKLFWEHFFKAETGTYEKSTWLDLFLAEYIIQTNAGANPKELLNFCPLSGVVSLVGCELLCGIHRVTSSIHTHCGAPMQCADNYAAAAETTSQDEWSKNEERRQQTSLFSRMNNQSSSEILRKYLLGGLAWKCLVLLKGLGVEGLSCCRQLSSVLLWVWGELRGGGGHKLQPTPSTTPIHQLFSPRIWTKQKSSGSKTSKIGSAVSSERSYAGSRTKRLSQGKNESNEKARRKIIKLPDASSESADSNDDLQILNRSLTIKVSTPDDFQYFDSPVRPNKIASNNSLFGDLYYPPRKTKPKAEDFMTDKHREIINSEITAYEFMLLVIDLLQELCKTESSLSGSEGSLISMQCINFSLRTLCSIQFGSLSSYSFHYDAVEQSSIKIALTQLLMVSLDKVLLHSDLCAKLINNGILPMLLRLIEDVLCKSSAKFNIKTDEQCRTKDAEKPNCVESENLLRFIFGIAYSITAFFHCLLMQCRTIDKLREFTEQFKLYGECLKGGLFKECIELMIRIPGVESVETTTLIKKLIESIGKLISGMKRVRSEVIHSAACPRSRHKVCRQRVTAGMHHHHDIMGEANSGLPMTSACCISVLYGTLTSLVTDEEVTAQTSLKTKILRVMLNCGVCCCFSSGFLMESIVRLMLTHNNVAPLCLQVLEHSVYGELGASVLIPKPLTDQLPCSICEPCDEKREFGRKYCTHGISPLERKTVWSFLIHYNSLLQLDNHNNVLHATVSHLLRVTPRCRTEMKYELLFSVIYPTFIVAKHRYMIRMEESAYFLTAACLNIFSSLLNTISFAEQFISKGGLSYVLELVTLSEFSSQCCSILEISIIVEIYKLMKDNSELPYYREMNSLASVQMFFKCLGDVTDKCFKIYKMKLPIEKFDDLCDVSKETENLAANLTRGGSYQVDPKRNSVPILIKSGYAQTENVLEDTVDDYLEVLKNISVFWRSCAGLCLYSPMFREFLLSESVLMDSYSLTKLLLYYLCHCEYGATEMRIVVKIVEALLTVQFAVSDVTSNRSGEASGRLLRSCLEEPAILLSAGCGAETDLLRVLSEALLRVSCAAPSDRHVMPTANPPKVPPLVCEEGGSSAECSSSEESVQPPYASEHSEHGFKGGMGYEADIEGGKLDSLTFKRKQSLSLSNSTINSDIPSSPHLLDQTSIECGEYVRNGELAHPELCSIVVDVLTQLIDKVVESGDARSVSRVQRMCGAVAAASGGAGVRGGATLRGLLRTLLRRLDHTPPELQRSILDLVQVLASQQVSGRELKALFSVLLCEKPPLVPVLGTLHHLAATAQRSPRDVLVFPMSLTQQGVELGREASPGLTSYTPNNDHFTRQPYLTYNNTGTGASSAWRVGAARVSVESAGGAPWLRGASFAVWIRTTQEKDSNHWHDTSSDPEDCEPRRPVKKEIKVTELLHVFSIGNDSLLFEMWLDPGSGVAKWSHIKDFFDKDNQNLNFVFAPALRKEHLNPNTKEKMRVKLAAQVFSHSVAAGMYAKISEGTLTFRISREGRPLSEGSTSGRLLPRCWSCVCVNISERLHKKRIAITAAVFVDGVEWPTVHLPFQGILVRKVTATSILLGHVSPPGGAPSSGGAPAARAPRLELGGLAVYRLPTITPTTATLLAARLPPYHILASGEHPNIPALLTPELLQSDIDWNQIYESPSATLRELQDDLLIMFSAHAPEVINLYHHPVNMPSSGAMFGRGAPPTSAPAAEVLALSWVSPPHCSHVHTLSTALLPQPNVDALLYLFARVVELEGTEEQQATALWIVLHTCLLDDQMYTAFYEEECLSMIHTVLQSNKCKISVYMLKAILDVAFSGNLLSCWSGRGILYATAEPVLKHPKLIAALMNAWRQLETKEVNWEVETGGSGRIEKSGTVWSLALDCLLIVFREDHPRRPFNVAQAERTKLLPALMHCIKERFLNSESAPPSPQVCTALVQVCRGLVPSPPAPEHAAFINDVLLLMHQASDTFVTHSRPNFYFLVTPETQESSNISTINFGEFDVKRKSIRRPKRHNMRPSISSNNSDDVPDENGLSSKGYKVQNRDMESDKTDHESSAESTKLLKGIINMQIKEKRKHTLSSTSETSTEGPEPWENNKKDTNMKEELPEPTVEVNGSDNDEDLSGYIVVEPQDVRENGEVYTWGAGVVAGLLNLLKDVIAALPHHLLPQAMASGVHPDRLVVLANQPSAGVRAALVELLAVLQRRTPIDPKRNLAFTYTHLANQISLYPGSMELAAACAALITKCDVPLEDQLNADIWTDVSEESLSRSGPLLSLLASTVHDVATSWAIVAVCRRITAQASLKLLSELSFVEAVIKAIKTIGAMTEEEIEERTELLAEMYDLLNDVTIKALASNYNMQIITDMHNLLTYLECSNIGTAISRLAEESQVSLFHAQLEYLEERLYSSYTQTNKYSNYFSTVLSSSFEANSRSELAARHGSTLQRAINFVLRMSPSRAREPRTKLMLRLMRYLLLAVGDSATQRPKWWVSTISSTEWVPSLLEMFWWGAAPADGTRPVQGDLLRLMYGAPPAALAQLVNTMPTCAKKMWMYVMCMVQHMHSISESGTAAVELAVTDWARGWAVAAQAGLPDRVLPADLHQHAAQHMQDDDQRWARLANSTRIRNAVAKSVFSKESICARVTDSAMATTRAVVEAQNYERKAFMELLRQAQATHAAAAQRWARLIERTTHRHAVWFDAARYPRSWALDPTEGRGRVRLRLRRAHLRINERFLKPHAKFKARIARLPAPLHGVVSGAAAGAGLRRGEAVCQQARVTLVTCARDAVGDLLLTDRCIHFIPEELEEANKKEPDPKKIDPSSIEDVTVQAWPLDTIVQVETRRWCLQEVALEIFLSTGRAHLLAFGTQAERDAFRAALPAKHAPKSQSDGLAEAMSAWRAGTITNWEYLMKLNGLAGRSYNDLMQYPVFPFVLSDYTSRTLDLTDPAVFRDLSKPMAIQNKSREAHYINTYNDLKAALRSGCSPQLSRQPHHYASLYSNSGGILHYMVRVPPFTQLLLAYQDKNFDMPDRTFHSLATTWRLITQDSPTDVKELIPEMFYLPELFYNREGLSLGVRQCGEAVEGVLAAAWAGDARLFTLLQRQALEAHVATTALHKWIDLVFGYKQTGQAAIDAINVFPPCTYYGFDPSSLANEVDRTAAHTMVRTYGQAPRQLLRTAHPQQTPALHPLPTGVWNNMVGVSWGRYCGSPALRKAGVAARRGAGAARAVLLPAPRAAALLPSAAALTQLHEEKGDESGCSVMLVTWGHADGYVRGKTRRDNTQEILLHAPNITSSGFVLTSSARPYPLFLGLSTGEVLAVRVSGTARCRARPLLAHKTSITSIHVCASTALLVTASVDGRVVLWDLNRLTYIRTLPNRRQLGVTHVTISPTLADVATVHDLTPRDPADLDPDSDDDDDLEYADRDTGADVDAYEQDTTNYKSLIRVYTCNGSFVASVKVPETVRCICYSSAAEGVSINVVCAGLSNGEIRLYCSWQLSPVTVIAPPTSPPSPAISVTYSSDSCILFACYADGASVAFESQDEEATRQQNIKLVPAHALL